MTKKRLLPDDRKLEILNAAIKVAGRPGGWSKLTRDAVAKEAGCSPAQVIIAWMRQSKPAILPIIAGSRTEQLAENIAGLGVTLTEPQMARLNTAGNPDAAQGWIQPS